MSVRMNRLGNKGESSDTESSLRGAFIDIALGSDLDNIDDRVSLQDDLEDLTEDEEDNINVTIRKITRPSLKYASTPKLASAVVVPES